MNKSGLKIENMWDTFLSREFTYSSGLHSNRTVGTRAPWAVFMKSLKLILMERLQILSLPDRKSSWIGGSRAVPEYTLHAERQGENGSPNMYLIELYNCGGSKESNVYSVWLSHKQYLLYFSSYESKKNIRLGMQYGRNTCVC